MLCRMLCSGLILSRLNVLSCRASQGNPEDIPWDQALSERDVRALTENGGGGIRTHGAREDTLVFKTRAINHSTTLQVGQP